MAFPCKALYINMGEYNEDMKNRTDQNLREVVYMSLVYHISDSWFRLLRGCYLYLWKTWQRKPAAYTICVSYPGGLATSAILGSFDYNKYLGKLITYLDPVLPSVSQSYFVRCWHARTDGSAASTFHSNCDGKGPTVTIIRVDQYIFGAYTDVSWHSKYHKT